MRYIKCEMKNDLLKQRCHEFTLRGQKYSTHEQCKGSEVYGCLFKEIMFKFTFISSFILELLYEEDLYSELDRNPKR